jgi:hypothetical protein
MMRGPSIQGIAKCANITWLCLYGMCHTSGYFLWILNTERRSHFQVILFETCDEIMNCIRYSSVFLCYRVAD